MKKRLFRALSVAVVAAAMLVTGCGKRTSTPSTSTLNGTYTVSTTPLYAKAAAIDPDAMAIDTEMNGEPLQLTYRQISGLLESMLPSQQLLDNEAEITFKDGALEIRNMTADGPVTVFPAPESGIPADMIVYTTSGNTLSMLVDLSVIDALLNQQDNTGTLTEGIHTMLASLTKGIAVYSEAANTLTVELRYTLSGTTLTVYAGKALLSDTWACISPIMNEVLPYLQSADPDTAAMLEVILPLIDPMLNGFSTLEVGIRMTK